MTVSALVWTQPWLSCEGVMLKFGREWTQKAKRPSGETAMPIPSSMVPGERFSATILPWAVSTTDTVVVSFGSVAGWSESMWLTSSRLPSGVSAR